MQQSFQMFMPLTKADEAKRLVWARAAVEQPDKSMEIMDYETGKPKFQEWSGRYSDVTMGKSLGNVRAMHNRQHLAGKVQAIDYNDDEKAVDVCIKVLDPVDWHKLEEGGYTGISIGGGYANRWDDLLLKGYKRYTPEISEISFVDAPCMPGALIMAMQKQDGAVVEVLLKGFLPRTFAELTPPRTFGELNKSLIGLGVGALAGGYAGRRIGALAGLAHGVATDNPERIARSMAIGSEVGRVGGAVAGGALGIHLTRRRDKDGRITGIKPAHVAKQELLDTLAKSAASGAGEAIGTFIHRGKTIIPKAANLTANTRGGAVSVDPAASGTPFAFQNRGKTFTSGKVTKQDLLDTLLKATASAAEREKIRLTLHEFKHGQLHSYRAGVPKKKMPKVTDRQQAIAIALSQARRMGKAEDPLVIANMLRLDEHLEKRAASIPRAHGELDSKDSDVRKTTARARWMAEDHDDLDVAHDANIARAKRSVLGRNRKVEDAQAVKHNAWHAVADSHEAYDAVRPHLPKEHGLMTAVAGHPDLLNNPEGIGPHDFDTKGKAKRPIYLLHPHEADDWIKKHGKGAVSKETPRGLITDLAQLTGEPLQEAA